MGGTGAPPSYEQCRCVGAAPAAGVLLGHCMVPAPRGSFVVQQLHPWATPCTPHTSPRADSGLGASFKMQMTQLCLTAMALMGCEFVPTNSILPYF